MIGVFGGTFDPIHFGHLRMALEVSQALELDQVRFVPCALPPHRAEASANAAFRLEMIRLATVGQADFIADRRELDRAGKSFTVDTLQSLRDEFPRMPLLLMLGMDAFRGLHTWNRWARIIELAHIVVFARDDLDLPVGGELGGLLASRKTRDRSRLSAFPCGSIWVESVTPLGISATAIRAHIARGLSPRYLVPDQVLEFIESHELYREEKHLNA